MGECSYNLATGTVIVLIKTDDLLLSWFFTYLQKDNKASNVTSKVA
jgi:hypothetical protein